MYSLTIPPYDPLIKTSNGWLLIKPYSYVFPWIVDKSLSVIDSAWVNVFNLFLLIDSYSFSSSQIEKYFFMILLNESSGLSLKTKYLFKSLIW